MALLERQNIVLPDTADVCPDIYFSAAQIQRLQELMQKFQAAEAPPEDVLTPEENLELHALIKAELQAAALRVAAMPGVLAP